MFHIFRQCVTKQIKKIPRCVVLTVTPNSPASTFALSGKMTLMPIFMEIHA
jgi:hypothetical protein